MGARTLRQGFWGTVDQATSDTAAPEGAAHGKETSRRGRGLGCAVEVIETLVLTLVIFFLIQNFVAQPFQVKGGSMERTFVESDYVLVDRLTPWWSTPRGIHQLGSSPRQPCRHRVSLQSPRVAPRVRTRVSDQRR